MAEEFEVVPMPDEVGVPIETLRRNAQWSDTFEASNTNLARRGDRSRLDRGNADKMACAEALQSQRRAQAMNELKTNKAAQDLYFRGEKLAMDQTAAQAALAERNQRMNFQKQIQPEILKGREAQTRAAMALEKARNDAAVLKAGLEERRALATSNFNKAMSGLTARPRTPEFNAALLRARMENPDMDSAIFDDIVKIGSSMTPEEAADNVKRLSEALPKNATVTGDSSGRLSATIRPETPAKPAKETADTWSKWKSDFTAAVGAYEKPGDVPAELWKTFEDRKAKLSGAPQPSAQSAAATEEMVSVMNPNGKPGKLPRSKLDAALKAGYKQR